MTPNNDDSLPIPSHTTQVYKDECVLCFKDPEDTLYVDMRSFFAYCHDHRPLDSGSTFLGVKATRVPKPAGERERRSS